MRSEEGVYLIDGPMLLDEALAAGAEIEVVYVEGEALDHPAVWTARRAGIRVRDVTDGALAKVLDLGAPQHMVAVALQQRLGLSEVIDAAVEHRRPVLVLVELGDPGNTGTLVRVAEAAGCAGVVLTANSVDLYNPKTVRATAGALFRVPVSEGHEVAEVLAELELAGIGSIATIGEGGPAPEDVDLRGAIAIVVGNEAHGLSAEVAGACSGRVTIPMDGAVESLNAAVAGSIVVFEAARQRRVGGIGHGGVGRAGDEPSGGAPVTVSNNDSPMRSSDASPATTPPDTGEHSDD